MIEQPRIAGFMVGAFDAITESSSESNYDFISA